MVFTADDLAYWTSRPIPRPEEWYTTAIVRLARRVGELEAENEQATYTAATERIAALEAQAVQLREENARLRHELGDALTECSIEGCAAWIVPIDDQDSYAGWIWTTKPDAGWPLALCPAHVGMAVSG